MLLFRFSERKNGKRIKIIICQCIKTKLNDFEINFEVGQIFMGLVAVNGYYVIGCETHTLCKSILVGRG